MINSIEIDKAAGTVYKRINRSDPKNIIIGDFLRNNFGYQDPLVEYEVELLERLAPFDIAPRVLSVDKDGYLMTFVGDSLSQRKPFWYPNRGRFTTLQRLIHRFSKEAKSAISQVEYILSVLGENNIKHNDLYNENIAVDDLGKIRVLDFTFANNSRVVGIGDLFPELSIKHENIFCARMSDSVLYQVVSPINWKKLKAKIMKEILDELPVSSGRAGAHIRAGRIYHELPFPELALPAHRKFSTVRIEKILANIPTNASRGIDIGCSVGSLSFYLQRYGKQMSAIDYDPESIRFAKKINQIKGYNVDFREQELNLGFVDKMPEYDFIIWLSNWMWIAKVQGVETAKKILLEVSKKSPLMFFDTAQGGSDKADLYQLDGKDAVYNLLRENTVYETIVDLGLSEEGYHQRNLFLCK